MAGTLRIIWDEDAGGNAEHIADNGLSFDDVESILEFPFEKLISRSSGRPLWIGRTLSGERACVVFDWCDVDLVYPVTAFRI
ncbi:MAG: hypothetical protein R3C19_13750 [Planctomycetaceae bacterium]